jgi:hypothetical protein
MALALRSLKEEAIRLHKEEGLRPFEILQREEFAGRTTRATIGGWLKAWREGKVEIPISS